VSTRNLIKPLDSFNILRLRNKKLQNFRIWIKPQQEMCYDIRSIIFDSTGNPQTVWCIPKDRIPTKVKASSCVFMESVGIKDSHGVLLYEEDVVYVTGGAFWAGTYELQERFLIQALDSHELVELVENAAEFVEHKGTSFELPESHYITYAAWLNKKNN